MKECHKKSSPKGFNQNEDTGNNRNEATIHSKAITRSLTSHTIENEALACDEQDANYLISCNPVPDISEQLQSMRSTQVDCLTLAMISAEDISDYLNKEFIKAQRFEHHATETFTLSAIKFGKILHELKRKVRDSDLNWGEYADTHVKCIKSRTRQKYMKLAQYESAEGYAFLGVELLYKLIKADEGFTSPDARHDFFSKNLIVTADGDIDKDETKFKKALSNEVPANEAQADEATSNKAPVDEATSNKAPADEATSNKAPKKDTRDEYQGHFKTLLSELKYLQTAFTENIYHPPQQDVEEIKKVMETLKVLVESYFEATPSIT